MAFATDADLDAEQAGVMRDRSLPADVFDAWAMAGGPERFALVAPLRDVLADEPEPPADLHRSMEPVRWLLERVARKSVPLGSDGFLHPRFAAWANEELGFETPPEIDGERTHLEIDAVFQLARNTGHCWPDGDIEVLTDCGRIVRRNTELLWRECAECIGAAPPPGLAGELWQTALAGLLRPDVEDLDFTASLAEAAQRAEDDGIASSLISETIPTTLFCLYTLGRGLSMFAPDARVAGRPRLSAFGSATVKVALRGAAFVHGLKARTA